MQMLVMCAKFSRTVFNVPGLAFLFLLCLGLVVLYPVALIHNCKEFFFKILKT